MLCIHLGMVLPAATELPGLAGVSGMFWKLSCSRLPCRRAGGCGAVLPIPALRWESGLGVSQQDTAGPPSRAGSGFPRCVLPLGTS